MSNPDQWLASYQFDLPPELIAQRPVSPRDHSRLLVYHTPSQEIVHTQFCHLHRYLPPHSQLILNDTKVFPCRIRGRKASGGQAEIFLLARTSTQGLFPALIKCSGKKKLGDGFIAAATTLELAKIDSDGTFWLKGDEHKVQNALTTEALVPIPPYIRDGVSDNLDREHYQTLYAKHTGSVAAPTAGLHFTPRVFHRLNEHDISTHSLTLHVGRGTFSAIQGERLQDHRMHQESFSIPPTTHCAIQRHWGELFCVGTTCLRVLESLPAGAGTRELGGNVAGETALFLHPGGPPIRSIRGLITNFHLPQSSLFVLVSALMGRERALELYHLAIEQRYRFFSYGDAMLVLLR